MKLGGEIGVMVHVLPLQISRYPSFKISKAFVVEPKLIKGYYNLKTKERKGERILQLPGC